MNSLSALFRRSLLIVRSELTSRMPFYAVQLGKKPGVYTTWPDCQAQTTGFRGARFKKFETEEEAQNFVDGTTGKKANATSSSAAQKKTTKGKKTEKSSDNSDSDSSKSSKSSKEEASKKKSSAKKRKTSTKDDESEEDSEVASKQAKTEEEIDPDAAVVYTDGCCINNGKGNPHGGVGVYWGPDHPNNLSEKLEGRQTNNRAEIYAAIRAVEQAKSLDIKKLVIKTDSAFLINCQTNWVKKWKKNGWKTSAGADVANRKELEELGVVEKDVSVQYVHVPAHTGIDGNEEADKLAKAGAKK